MLLEEFNGAPSGCRLINGKREGRKGQTKKGKTKRDSVSPHLLLVIVCFLHTPQIYSFLLLLSAKRLVIEYRGVLK